jgi:hypothetical protein
MHVLHKQMEVLDISPPNIREITPQDFHKLLGLNQSIGETRRHQSDTISGKLTKILQQIREAKLDFKEIT